MWNWFKKNPVKRIGGTVIAAAAILLLLKISAFVGTLLFKLIFLVAIGVFAFLGYKKMAAKFKPKRKMSSLAEDNSKVTRKKSATRT